MQNWEDMSVGKKTAAIVAGVVCVSLVLLFALKLDDPANRRVCVHSHMEVYYTWQSICDAKGQNCSGHMEPEYYDVCDEYENQRCTEMKPATKWRGKVCEAYIRSDW